MALNRCSRVGKIIPSVLRIYGTPAGSGTGAATRSHGIRFPSVRRECSLLTFLVGNTLKVKDALVGRVGSPCRAYSSSPATDVSYEQLKASLAARTGVVVDVREPWELREYGNIPGSINVPLGQLNQALQLTPGEFKEKYGGDMPSQTENIIFTCLAGVRSKTALDSAISLGYSNVQHYPGGWQDWAKHEILQSKQ
ncbi:thiosulfate sulfurtransferase/rhodanese-like domain-containing protein 3 isoform X1 [Denticeps clupeoides]|uniref:thiosulfate sulfurtransferase/rhodanese-like domain-containing protein 3 isoform X1 n=1 Tax=Denticeps clupeoides TaxID=299321 RepID=UPI0010A4C01F|nr:thiosulfate sulfurtransferase/rhodanese-like domain-containing protein 3 isoform X1 [Denticeps clupeoides]